MDLGLGFEVVGVANVDAGARPGQTQRIRFTIDQPGTYPILPGPDPGADAFSVTYTRSQEDPFLFDPFFGTGGTLTVTASGTSRVTGRLSFSADAGSGRVIQVEGTFDAVPGR